MAAVTRRPSRIWSRPIVPCGWRRRSVGDPGLKIRSPGAPGAPGAGWSSGMWECPNTTRSAPGNLRRSRVSRPAAAPLSCTMLTFRPSRSSSAVLGAPHSATSGPSLLPSTAVTGAYSASSARTAAVQTSPACKMRRPYADARPPGAGRPATGAARECQPARRPARNPLSLVARSAAPARSGRGGSAWLVHVAGVDVVDGRHDRGERAADLFGGFPPSVLYLRLLRGGGEPPGGVEAPAVTFGRLDGPVDHGGQQADEQDDKDGDQHSHGHHPFQRPGRGD